MKPATATLAIVALLAALAGAAWWIGNAPAVPESTATAEAPASAFQAAMGGTATPPDSPQARTWRERQDFEAGARDFFNGAASMGQVQRSERARELTASIDRYENSGGLSAGEALLLRSGLIKATVEDEQLQARRLAELMERYRKHADQRMQDYAQEHARDPRFQDYKQREQAIVEQVMAMQTIPGGLSRDQYLRQLLQQARESAYR